MVIQQIEPIGNDCYKLTADTAGEFFIRAEYLRLVCADDLRAGVEFVDAREDDLLDAGLAFAAERKAVSYLERSEQCRAGLTKKLIQKNFSREAVALALDYLERRDFLSDARFCRAWLNSRRNIKPQGRTRLLAELAARGIAKAVSDEAVRAFLLENDEYALCRRAVAKRRREKKSDEKLVAALVRDGFSYKMVSRALAEE